ncbi:MAG: hypothetical protein A3E85_02905 [Gammaproteobacteria bacterium RIFCSPHIGHO2_12_FULL_45_12]|nr:MAG: hypothetical protein A3E85_02905 [Gammaproteobacteria bacterium RIFCSPHIGHO2_12_FULL_45_12]
MKASRKHLSAQGLLTVIHHHFKAIQSPRERAPRSNPITLTDCLMSGPAVFGLKFPSLLKFDEGSNVYDIMRGGRTNWRIENNTFNTLKNQDYHFAHHFGHGYQNLCTVFGMLMMLAFLSIKCKSSVVICLRKRVRNLNPERVCGLKYAACLTNF